MTRVDNTVQESKEVVEHVKEHWTEWKQILTELQTQITLETPLTDHDWANPIEELCQSFDNLDISDQAHQLFALILEMNDIDPESLQFEDDPCSWNEARNSVDGKWWEAGYWEELQSLKDMNIYKLIQHEEVPSGCHICKGHPGFHIKRDETSKPIQWKVCLVFKGFEQIYGKD